MNFKTPRTSTAKPKLARTKIRANLWRAGALVLVPVYCFLQFTGHAMAALSTDQQNAFSLNVQYTNTEDSCGDYNDAGGSSSGGGVTTAADVAPNDRQQAAFTAFMGIGFTAEQAAGIVGNLMQESHPTIDPTATNSIGAYGIAQWLGGRKDNLLKLPNYDTFGVQLNYLIKTDLPAEDQTYHVIARVKAANSVEDAAFAWEDTFERAGDVKGDADILQRTKYGNEVLKAYGTTAGSGSGTSTVTPVSDVTSTCSEAGGTTAGIGTGTGKFTTAPGTPDGVSAADVQATLARIQQLIIIKPPSSLLLAACPGSGLCHDRCDHLMAYAWGYANSGYDTAYDHWLAIKDKYGHPGDRNPPIGALLFYSNSASGTSASGDGHIAIYVGNNEVFSNDIGDPQSGVTGGAYVVSADKIESAGWNLQYLGWASPAAGAFNSPKY